MREEVIGLIPAGGQATRISPLPCSKELFPVGLRPKAVSHYLLEKMKLAGIAKAYIVLRPGKWDIPGYFGDGSSLNMHLAYLMMSSPLGVPYTLDQAYPFVRDAVVAFGFPDILFRSKNVFTRLLSRLRSIHADILLGLFPADSPQKLDMIEVDFSARVQRLVIKPQDTDLSFTWGIAVWTPAFTQFLHDYLSLREVSAAQPELSAGEVIQAAVRNKLRVDAVPVSEDAYLDIGTPQDLLKAVHFSHRQMGTLPQRWVK